MISLLCPSRARPEMFERMVRSAIDTASMPLTVEVICYRDSDDESEYPVLSRGGYVTGERIVLSEMWNRCYEESMGEIVMHCGDDLIFRTEAWDDIVRVAFAEAPDPYVFVHGDDLGPHGQTFGTHGFVTQEWVEALGYFVPPYFSSDWNDVWLNEVANDIGRRVLIDIVTEHMHYSFGKAEFDITHQERVRRGDEDGVVDLYISKQRERIRDANKLRKAIGEWQQIPA